MSQDSKPWNPWVILLVTVLLVVLVGAIMTLSGCSTTPAPTPTVTDLPMIGSLHVGTIISPVPGDILVVNVPLRGKYVTYTINFVAVGVDRVTVEDQPSCVWNSLGNLQEYMCDGFDVLDLDPGSQWKIGSYRGDLIHPGP